MNTEAPILSENHETAPEKGRRMFFLGAHFVGRNKFIRQLKNTHGRICDKDWSKYEYGTSKINQEALKYENEIRLALIAGWVPMLVGLDVSTLSPDLRVNRKNSVLLVISQIYP